MIRPGFVLRMALREARTARRRVLALTAAIGVGVAALTAITSFADNLQRAVDRQARSLLGADVSVSGNEPFPARADSAIARLAEGGEVARTTSFSAMAFVPRSGLTRLVQVRAVESGYPFYSQPETDPPGIWPQLQQGRFAVAEPSFLTALGAEPGDTVALGESRFVLLGVAENLPGSLSLRSAFGPRLWIAARYLGETRLLTFGSRATYTALIRLPDTADAESRVRPARADLRALQLRVRTARDNQEDLKDSFDQLGRFLGLVALIALLLGGIGVASAIQVFIRRKRETIAVLRCLGATSGEVFAVYLAQAAAMGLLGSAAGAAAGLAVQLALPQVLAPFLPLEVSVRPSPAAIALGFGVGLWVALAFALLPLLGARDVSPLAALRQPYEDAGPHRSSWPRWAARLLVAASVALLVLIQVGDLVRGALFAAALGAALLVLWLAALGLIRALRRWFPRRLPYVFRQGLGNLYRPANQTVAVVLALGAGAFLLGSLTVVRHNLLARLALDLRANRPNLVLFDIQPGQLEPLRSLLAGRGLQVQPAVPIVPMRILAINGRSSVELIADTAGKRGDTRASPWALRREYRSTYRDTLVASEKLVAGRWWERGWKGTGVVPVSLETSIAGDLAVTIGDTIVWDIQGVPLVTVIASLREVEWVRFEPNFFMVFPPGPRDQAPQSYVLLTRVEEGPELGRVQREVVQRFPNVASLDLSSVQRTIERIVSSVVAAIRFMALFSLATGLVVLAGALATSRFQRLREAALLKTLGARRRDVVRVMVTEYAALGLLAGAVAAGLAAAGGWALVRFVFEVPFAFPWPAFGTLALVLVILTVGTGLWSSAEVFRRTPLEVLRSE